MQLAQKLLSTISMEFESKNYILAIEILRDIKYFYQDKKYTELDGLLSQVINEILTNYKDENIKKC